MIMLGLWGLNEFIVRVSMNFSWDISHVIRGFEGHGFCTIRDARIQWQSFRSVTSSSCYCKLALVKLSSMHSSSVFYALHLLSGNGGYGDYIEIQICCDSHANIFVVMELHCQILVFGFFINFHYHSHTNFKSLSGDWWWWIVFWWIT